MKRFTANDISYTGLFPHLWVLDADLVDDPLWWQKKGLQETASGYGRKLRTSRKIWFDGKLRRIYCTIFSNNGSTWITAKETKGGKVYVN